MTSSAPSLRPTSGAPPPQPRRRHPHGRGRRGGAGGALLVPCSAAVEIAARAGRRSDEPACAHRRIATARSWRAATNCSRSTVRVINPTDKEQQVPPLQAQLKSPTGKVVYSWTIAPPTRTLPPGRAPASTARSDVPAGGEEATITVVSRAPRPAIHSNSISFAGCVAPSVDAHHWRSGASPTIGPSPRRNTAPDTMRTVACALAETATKVATRRTARCKDSGDGEQQHGEGVTPGPLNGKEHINFCAETDHLPQAKVGIAPLWPLC